MRDQQTLRQTSFEASLSHEKGLGISEKRPSQGFITLVKINKKQVFTATKNIKFVWL